MSEKHGGHVNQSPDDIIHELGGCGRFQIQMAVIVHTMKIVFCWSSMAMIFVTATPKWWCTNEADQMNLTLFTNTTRLKTCATGNDTTCSTFDFETTDMHTVVSEWKLVCDRAWIPTTMMTVQLIFQLLGNFSAGQLADTFGRKIPFFSSLILAILFNLLVYFSVNWVMFLVCRVFIGIAAGIFMTIQYSYLSEFSLARWRAWLTGFPSWPLQTCLLALVLWLLKDWRNIHLLTALIGIPFIVAWWLIPESFRWYYSHDRIEEAERVIKTVSKVNRRPSPDMAFMEQLAVTTKDRKYTAIDLFRSRFLIRITVLLSLNWFVLGMSTYGISFGIQNLSWNIYLNLFLFNIVNIPAKGISIWLQNRFGRRIACMICYLITGITALIAGAAQYIDTDKKDALTNGFAMVANLGMGMAWGPVQTMTIETYPTVVRNIGFGFVSVLTRIGGALGPQLVYLDTLIPGVVYFVCGGLSVLCVFGTIGIPETKDSNLNDKLNDNRIKRVKDGVI